MEDEQQADEVQVWEELFRGLICLAPGSPATTRAVLAQVGDSLPAASLVVDMGCGAGAAALVLAEELPAARIVAVDLLEPFVAAVRARAQAAGCADRVVAHVGDMAAQATIGLQPGTVDLLWSVAAAYSIGVEAALAAWKPLLRPGGLLVFSELVWVAAEADRSAAATALWAREYPAMRHRDEIERTVDASGLERIGGCRQPRSDWDAYYGPLRPRVADMRRAAPAGSAARAILDAMQEEIDVFDSGDESYAYEFFVARRPDVG
jgi:SAM-dependent methyltransferase